ncbi:MAG: PAS domain S-box protein [Methylomonas sp.]
MNQIIEKKEERKKLRNRAEKMLVGQSTLCMDATANEKKLLHELQIHQIELEVQNEALQQAWDAEKTSLASYTELFDFAPIAYFKVTLDGRILQTNFCGATLLGRDRSELIDRHLLNFVRASDRSVFAAFLHNLTTDDRQNTCEVCFESAKAISWVRIEAALDRQQHGYLLAVMDISERKRHEEALQLASVVYRALGEAVMVAAAETSLSWSMQHSRPLRDTPPKRREANRHRC